ncbi:putative leader peptide [Pseudonocardia sp. CA-142604]|uniref:putative leader peptide n=1 Tax=Pseudonocardia sp. CA-142604 TaxID=3240024 RepID=UPI003D90AEAF
MVRHEQRSELPHHIWLRELRSSARVVSVNGVLLTQRRHVDLCRLASCVCPG